MDILASVHFIYLYLTLPVVFNSRRIFGHQLYGLINVNCSPEDKKSPRSKNMDAWVHCFYFNCDGMEYLDLALKQRFLVCFFKEPIHEDRKSTYRFI